MEVLRLENLSYAYGRNQVLNHINYSFKEGMLYAVTGRSGAGKTTLLSLLSGLTQPQEGSVVLRGEDLKTKDPYEYRSHDIGVVFQSFNLLTKLTAAENVELSLDISGAPKEGRQERVTQLLHQVGITEEEGLRRVLKLSGGQQQRVAIARALSYDPDIILADEPTGNLDEYTQAEIMKIFRRLANEGKCVIIVTHSRYVASQADEVLNLEKINGPAPARPAAKKPTAKKPAAKAPAPATK